MKLVFQTKFWEFLGSPVVRTQRFHCHGPRFNPWSGNEDPAKLHGTAKRKLFLCELYYIKWENQSCQVERRSLPLRALHIAEQVVHCTTLGVTMHMSNSMIQS